jgi:hypothetical protein
MALTNLGAAAGVVTISIWLKVKPRDVVDFVVAVLQPSGHFLLCALTLKTTEQTRRTINDVHHNTEGSFDLLLPVFLHLLVQDNFDTRR